MLTSAVRFFLSLALILFLGACSGSDVPKPKADEVGNGGDLLAKRFEAGRQKAILILKALPEILPADLETSRNADDLIRYYKDRRLELVEDVEQTPPYQWVGENPNHACGLTTTAPRAPIRLSYKECQGITNVTDAAIHLIGEAIHHLGVGVDSFTAQLSIAVKRGWNRVLGLKSESITKRLIFEQGRAHASEVLFRLDPGFTPVSCTRDDWQWLLSHRDELATKIAKTPHDWTDELSGKQEDSYSSCARFDNERQRFELSYSGCDDSLDSRTEAGQLLLFSSLETYFGVEGKDRASRIAAEVYSAWFRKHPEAPHGTAMASEGKMCGRLSAHTSDGLHTYLIEATPIAPGNPEARAYLEGTALGRRVCALGHWSDDSFKLNIVSYLWDAHIRFSPAASKAIFDGMKRAGVPNSGGQGVSLLASLMSICDRYNDGLITCDYVSLNSQHGYHAQGPAEAEVYEALRNSDLPVTPMRGNQGWTISFGELYCRKIPSLHRGPTCWEDE